MKSIKWKILRRIGAFVLAAALVAGGQPFCSCADEAAAEEEIGPGIIPKVNPEDLTPLVVNYSAYQDSVGWSEVKADNDPLKVQTGSFASAIRMTVSGQPEVLKGTLAYQVNIIGKGWLDWGENDVEIGAAPEQLPIEAVAMKFTDRLAEYYDIYYSVWENGAWTEWAMNGAGGGSGRLRYPCGRLKGRGCDQGGRSAGDKTGGNRSYEAHGGPYL